jgi:hypothetical protein
MIILYAKMNETLIEREIILLRNKVKNISNQTGIPSMNERPMDAEAYFGLSEEVFNAVNLNVDSEEYEIGNYLQKLHIKNHVVASKEVVHDLFTEQEEIIELDFQCLSSEDELLFADIQVAVSEKEIVDLRANLKSIAQSVSIHERTFEEIEDYVNGELDDEIEMLIREEAALNSDLSIEIDLHNEINNAIEEQDIMKLRASLREMIHNEYSHARSIEEIDGYLNGELDDDTVSLLEEELMSNSGFAADLNFHREVDKAISESEVMFLRARLQQIAQEEQARTSEKLGISPHKKNRVFWYAAASVIILMLALATLIRPKNYSEQDLYASYYKSYKGGELVSRSAMLSNSGLNMALREMNKGDYRSALHLLAGTPVTFQNGYSVNFYSGVAYQELGEFHSAINSFSKVVQHGDNLLVEQSEWYIGLCYLKTEERQKAVDQFRSIVAKKGFYKDQSSKILQQLE